MKDSNMQSILNKQRLDKFRLVLTLPPVLRNINIVNWNATDDESINVDSLQYSLYSAIIPEVSIPSIPIPYQGQTMKVTSQIREAYAPVTCKFVVDNRFRNYHVLWKWLEMINDPIHTGMDDSMAMSNVSRNTGQLDTNMADFLGYQSRISIFPLDEYNNEMCEFIFRNSFITKLGGMSFNFQDSNQVDCSFTFDFGQMDIRLLD